MFILSDETPAEWWPVTWTGFAEDGGEVENRIEMKFFRLGRDRLADLYRSMSAAAAAETSDGTDAADVERFIAALVGDPDKDLRIVMEMAADWRGIGVVEDGRKPAPLPFSETNVRRLLNSAAFSEAVGLAHVEFAIHLKETRRGNSKPSPAGGQATAPESPAPEPPAPEPPAMTNLAAARSRRR